MVTVAYATQDGTAVADSDYTATSGTLRFEPGETMQTIRVPTLRDAIAEPSENFRVELSDPAGTTITSATGVGTIAANAMPGLSIADAATVAEGGDAAFPVTLNPASGQVVTVTYATQDGTAVADSDYTALLHESSLARTMPTDRILTCQCDTTLVGRGRSSDSGSHSRERPHSPAQLDSGREGYRR